MDVIKRLERQLEHMERSYRLGLIKKDEFETVKKGIQQKLKQVRLMNKAEKRKEEVIKKLPERRRKITPTSPEIDVRLLVAAGIIIVLSFALYWYSANLGQTDSVTLVEYSDFSCEHCKDAQSTIHELQRKYGERLVHEFRHFPLGERGMLAAKASECAAIQNAFWEYHDMLFLNNNLLDRAAFITYSEDLGLNAKQFTTCLDSEDVMSTINRDINNGIKRGVNATPTFFIGDTKVVGALDVEVFTEIIEKTEKLK